MAYRYNISSIISDAETIKAINNSEPYLLSTNMAGSLSSRSSGELNTERLIASANDIMSETLSDKINDEMSVNSQFDNNGLDSVRSDAESLQEEVSCLQHDMNALVQAVKNSQKSGHWELDRDAFLALDPETVFGQSFTNSQVPQLSKPNGIPLVNNFQNQVRDLQIENLRLKAELKSNQLLAGSQACPPRNRNVLSNDVIEMSRLRSEMNTAQFKMSQLQRDLQLRANRVADLEEQNRQLRQALNVKETEATETLHNLKKVDEKFGQEISSYEKRIKCLESELKRKEEERLSANEELNLLKVEAREALCEKSELFKGEIRRRDETIESLRNDILQVNANGTESRECDLDDMATLRQQHATSLEQVKRLTESLTKVQLTLKESRDALSTEVAERHDMVLRLKAEIKEQEAKHRDALQSAQQQTDALREDAKSLTLRMQTLERSSEKLRRTADENARSAETLRMRLEETQMEGNRREALHRMELLQREEVAQTLTAQNARLQVSLARSAELLATKETQAEGLGEQLKQVQDVLCPTLQQDLKDARSEASQARDELARCQITLKKFEVDSVALRREYESVVEENGRMEAQIKAATSNAKSEQVMLSDEVKRREESLQTLKLKQLRLGEELSRAEEQLALRERANDALQQQMTQLRSQIALKESELTRVAEDVDEMTRQARVQQDARQREQELREELQSELKGAKLEMESKDVFIGQIKSDYEALNQSSKELLNKVRQRDELLHKLSSETHKLKNKYREKIAQMQSLKEANEVNTRELKRHQEEQLIIKEDMIKELQDDLVDLKVQYATCYQELIKSEEERESLKESNQQLQEQCLRVENEVVQQRQSQEHVELQLAMATEKHRTAQNEVQQRNYELLRLRNELDSAKQRHSEAMAELGNHERDVDRGLEKLRQAQDEIRHLRQENAHTEEKRCVEMHTNTRIHNEMQMTLDEVRNHLHTIDSLKSELAMERDVHSKEVSTLHEHIQELQDQLQMANNDLQMLNDSLSSSQSALDAAHHEVSALQNVRTELQVDRSRLETRLKECESAFHQQKLLAERADKDLDTSRREAIALEKELVELRSRQQQTQLQVEKVQAQLSGARDTERERKLHIEKVELERQNVERQLVDRQWQVERCEKVIGQLTIELNDSQKELNCSCDTIGALKHQLQSTNNELLEQTREIADLHHALESTKAEANRYRETHTTRNQDVEEYRAQISHMNVEFNELRNQLSAKTHTFKDVQECIHELKQEVSSLRDFKASSSEEIGQLELVVQRMHDERESLFEKHEDDLIRMEACVEQLESDNKSYQTQLGQLQNELQRYQEEAALKKNELRATNEQIDQQTNTIEQLKMHCGALEREKKALAQQLTRADEFTQRQRQELQDAHSQLREAVQEVAHFEESIALMEKQLAATQEELSMKVQDVVKTECEMKRSAVECRSAVERCLTAEEDAREFKMALEKARKELQATRDEMHRAVQQEWHFKQEWDKMRSEVDASKSHEQMLLEQVGKLERLLEEHQTELKSERQRASTFNKQLEQQKRLATDVQDKLQVLQRQEKDVNLRLNESESALILARDDRDQLAIKLRDAQQALSESEMEARMLEENVAKFDKNLRHRVEEVQRYEETLAHVQHRLSDKEETAKQLEAQLKEEQMSTSRAQVELKALTEQLTSRQSELADTRLLLTQSNAQVTELTKEVTQLEDEVRQVRADSERQTDVLTRQEDQFELLHERLQQTEEKVAQIDASRRQTAEQLAMTEHELEMTCQQVARGQDEIRSRSKELECVQKQLQTVGDEAVNLRQALEDARINSERLHRESEMVVSNVSSWVHEQKFANDKLGCKIKDQSTAIVTLQQERDRLMEQVLYLTNQLNTVKKETSQVKHEAESERVLALQQHAAKQQSLLNQLREKLEEYERDAELVSSRDVVVEEMHGRLKANVDSITRLNQQLNTLQKDLRRVKSELEQEKVVSASFRTQVENKEQTILSLKAQLESKAFQVYFDERKSLDKGDMVDRVKIKQHVENALRATGLTDPSQLDKSYWIQRVGELSIQLQQSSEYWSEKMRELSSNLNNRDYSRT